MDVFVSYAQEDLQSARNVCDAAERLGIQCWIADRNITAGDRWANAIQNALRSSTVFVVLLSKDAFRSDHVERELNQAVTYQKKIIPYRLDHATMTDSFEYLLSTIQWEDASRTSIDELAKQLRSMLPGRRGPDIISRPRKKPGTVPDVKSLDELTRNQESFSIKGALARLFDDK